MVQKRSTGWVGWIYFASVLMMLAGGLNIIAGLTGIFNGDFYASVNGQLLVLDYSSWGWIHLLLGAAVLAAGMALLTGQTWGRVVAVILVIFSMLANAAFLPVYPWWSAIVLAIDAIVLYAITMHGNEVQTN